ncbi:MAG: dTDP-4-dehydrorhamnose 3,5-epimerase [Methanobrevibacter sp.]|nr:dTDP-4-dehydrorhamnose 3,5-epimerase [Methanobrevibacter sp.]
MSKFKFIKTDINDVFIIEPTVFSDSRGYFMETFNLKDFKENTGLNIVFVQNNQSKSSKNVLRGLHFQYTKPQGKLVRVIKGEVFDVAVDLRKNSISYGKWVGEILSEENKRQLFVPEGFAHGFLVLSDYAEFVYSCTNFYDEHDEGGILWNDPDIAINWPIDKEKIILSEKDNKWGSFKQTRTNY